MTTIGRSITPKSTIVRLGRCRILYEKRPVQGLSVTFGSREEQVVRGRRVLTMAHEKRIIMF